MTSNKKKKEEIPILKEQEEIREALKKVEKKVYEKPKEEFVLQSYQFREFVKGKKETEETKTFFEKACKFSGKYLNIGISGEQGKKLDETLQFIGYNISSKDVTSFSILVFIICMAISGILFMIAFQFAVAFLVIGLISLFGVQMYPNYVRRFETMEIMNMMPLAITYIVIYMRTSPTLEGAVKFATKHLSGALARDLKKMVWDLENKIYLNMDDALKKYAEKWRDTNKNFSIAIDIIRSSQQIGNEKERLRVLDEAARVILKGNLGTMKEFSRSLRMPVMVLYMLCIVLPVMGLVIAPILTTLMAQGLNVNVLILVYNVVLPLFVYFFLKDILSKRPGAFSRPDIGDYPGLAKPGHAMIGSIEVPLMPLAVIIFVLITIPGWTLIWNPPKPGYDFVSILKSMTFVWAAAAAISIYGLGSSMQKLKVRENVEKIEDSIDVVLLGLADRLSMGSPIERAVVESAQTLKKGPTQDFLMRISTNMNSLGVPLDVAVFDEKFGAIVYYPSKLLKTIMEVIIESTQKGLRAASISMATISRYLENLKIVKENIESLIGSTVSSMKFQAQFLTSFISGIIISLDILLVRILAELGGKLEALEIPMSSDFIGSGTAAVSSIFKNSMFNVAGVVPAEYMQIIVGVYMIEVTFLLSLLINGVQNGKDDIYRNYTIGQNILLSTFVYTIAMIAGILMFSSFKIVAY